MKTITPTIENKLEFTLTANHAASSYGIPVLVDEEGSAFGPSDIIATGETAKAFVQRWMAGGMRIARRSFGSAPEFIERMDVETDDPLAIDEQNEMMRLFVA